MSSVRRTRGTISWRPERGAYFVRWGAPDGTRKQLRGGRTIAEANAVLAAVFNDERRDAGGQPAERLLHEFLADEHLRLAVSQRREIKSSYSACEPIQNQTMSSRSRTPTARWCSPTRTDQYGCVAWICLKSRPGENGSAANRR